MDCPSCGIENPASHRFCQQCGAALPAGCPRCGFAMPPGVRFCGSCGVPLAEQPPAAASPRRAEHPAERRQVTVLFADLCGYTQLAHALDAEETHAVLGAFFARVDRIVVEHGGAVDKHVGDCVMAVFGAPVAHDNDAERAAHAALAIQAAMPELAGQLGHEIGVHIGIASGQVVASSTGSEAHLEYTVTGDSVNLASRLTERAGRGEILISHAVRALLPDRFALIEAGQLAVKGLAAPVHAWRLSGLGSGTPGESRPFVGRRAELTQLEGVLRACQETGSGQTMHLRGEAGIGKSRLVEELEARARAAGFVCHKGLVLDFGSGTGQDAIRTLVRSLLGVSGERGDLPAAAEQALEAGLLPASARVFLNDLLDLPQPPALRALYDAMTNAARNQGKRETLAELLANRSRSRPQLLVVEDLHWADRVTLEHLAHLRQVVGRCPAILVLTSRVEGDPLDHAWRAAGGAAPLLTIDLGPLRADEVAALASAYLNLSAERTRRCIERAAGNPLFLDQLLRHAEASADGGVPGSVQSLVQARLDQLAPADKAALQAASVLGQRFAPAALRALLGGPDYDPAILIQHFLVRPAGEELLFAHALVRDAVYDTLLRRARRALHGRAALWYADIDPILHAEHLDRAEDPRAPAAYLAVSRAQARAYHYERALALVARGLELAQQPADRCALTCWQGELLHDLGDMAAAGQAFQAALDAAGDDRERVAARLGLAAVKRVTDDLDGAYAELEVCQELAERAGLDEQRARVHFLRGNLHFPRGDVEGCLAEHTRSLELARAVGSGELEAQALGGLGDAEYMRGRMRSAHERFTGCVALCREHGLGRIEVANASMVGHAGLYFRPQRQAVGDALEAAAAAARVGHARAELNARLAAFFGLYEMAALAQLREQVERAQGLVRRLGAGRFEQACLLYLGRAAAVEGCGEEATRLLREALEVSRRTGIGFHGPNILGALARVLDDPAERRRTLDEGEAILRTGCVGHNHLRYYPDAIATALELGDYDSAERYAGALETFTRPEPLAWADLFIASGRALAALGRGRRDASLRAELERLAANARALDLELAAREIDRVLAQP